MTTKFMNFLAMNWFISVLICVILEGSYFGAHGTTGILNSLIPFTWFTVAGIPIPVFNFNFFSGVIKLLTWDYSFYTGGYEIVRWFWCAIFSPGAVWGMASAMAFVYSSFLSRVFSFA
jgi:hypothetical protein